MINKIAIAHQLVSLARQIVARPVYRWDDVNRIIAQVKSGHLAVTKGAMEIAEILDRKLTFMSLGDFQRAHSTVITDSDELDDAKYDLMNNIMEAFMDAVKNDNHDTFDGAVDSLKEWAKTYGVEI